MSIDRRITNGLAWAGVFIVVGVPAADLLSAGIVNTMGLMGITSIDELTLEHVRMRSA